jgi:glycerophosphoryl diester phosphodiesterase
MRAVRKRGYRGPTAFALPEVLTLLAIPRALRRIKPVRGTAVQVPPRASVVNFASRWFIRKCHMLGLRVDYWTINDPAEAERLLELGADGIMTDDPAALAPVFERRYG